MVAPEGAVAVLSDFEPNDPVPGLQPEPEPSRSRVPKPDGAPYSEFSFGTPFSS